MGCSRTSSGKESVVMKNRKATLKKKASELSTLCGAEVCMVFLDAANGNLEVWSEDVDKANATIINYNHIIQSQPPPKKPKTTTTSNKPPSASDLNLKEKKKQIILDQSRATAGESSYTTTTTTTDDDKNSNFHGINSMWDGNLENLSKESFIGLSSCLEAKIQTLGHKIDQFHNMKDKEPKAADIQQLYDDKIGPIIDGGFDDRFEIIPSCSFDMKNPHYMITNNCNMVTVDQFHQFQPSLPLATMEFSSDRDRATMADSDSDSLSNFNNIINDATWADYFTDVDVGNTISIDDDDGSDDQYWNNILEVVEIDPDLGSDLYFLLEDNKEISY